MKALCLVAAATLLLFAGFCSMAAGDDLSLGYTLTIDAPQTRTGRVTVAISGLAGKGLTLVRPDGVGQQSWFDDVRATDASGEALTVAKVAGGYYVTTGGKPEIEVTYTIFPGTVGSYGHVGLICAEYAALDGSLVFLLPDEEHTIREARFSFSGPENWRPIVAWPKSKGVYTVDASFAPPRLQLQRSLLCFGNFRRISKGFGTNTLNVYASDIYPEKHREMLADGIQKVYAETYELLGFETGREYSVVCLPLAPDGLPVSAGAWSDGIALTLAGNLKRNQASDYWREYARFLMAAYFAEEPFGVRLTKEDWWFYPALFRYAEGRALVTLGRIDENLFYSSIYSDYAAEATQFGSTLDIPFKAVDSASAEARHFLRNTKAPILIMRLDYEIRAATHGADTIESLIKALYEKHGQGTAPTGVLEVLREMTNADFQDFYDRFVRSRSLILPMWPAYIALVRKTARKGPGKIAAEVDGVPIYERDVDVLADALAEKKALLKRGEGRRIAISVLVNEKLMDKALAKRRISVVPEIFWELRNALSARVIRLIITRKRQALKDVLYDEWLNDQRETTTVDIKPQQPPAPSAAGRAGKGHTLLQNTPAR